MKKIKTITAVLLAASVMLQLTGCMGGSRFSSKKLAGYAEDQGAEVYDDADDFNDYIEEAVEEEEISMLEDGIVITTDENKDILRDGPLGDMYVYSKDIEQTTFYVVSLGARELDDDAIAMVGAMDYGSSSAASEAYEDILDELEDNLESFEQLGYSADSESDNDKGIEYTIATCEMNRNCRGYGYYLHGSSILFVFGVGAQMDSVEDVLDGICGDLGVISPSEL